VYIVTQIEARARPDFGAAISPVAYGDYFPRGRRAGDIPSHPNPPS